MFWITDLSLADPYLPKKLQEGKSDKVKWCTACDNCIEFLIRQKNVGCATYEKEYTEFKLAPIDCEIGPQIKCCVFHSTSGDYLLLKVTHEVTDAAGTKEIASLISETYLKLKEDPDFRPIPNINGSRGIFQVLRHIPWYTYIGVVYRLIINFLPIMKSFVIKAQE